MYPRPRRLIIAQYQRPAHISLVAAAELLGEGRRAIAAQVVDLAVRRTISISRPAGQSRRSGFTITVTGDVAAEGPDEQAVLVAMYDNHLPAPGATISIRPGRNRSLGLLLQHPHRLAVARLVTAGLAREKNLLVKLLQPWRRQPVVATERAFPIVDHLWGMRDYIALAEQQRFAMLQSPEGVDRMRVGELDQLRVYERLLPFAVLFNLEKQWMSELDLRVRDLPSDLVASVGDPADLLSIAVQAAELVVNLAELADVVAAADVLEGVGAIFGGIAEFIGGLTP